MKWSNHLIMRKCAKFDFKLDLYWTNQMMSKLVWQLLFNAWCFWFRTSNKSKFKLKLGTSNKNEKNLKQVMIIPNVFRFVKFK